jgi:hypothetical protein
VRARTAAVAVLLGALAGCASSAPKEDGPRLVAGGADKAGGEVPGVRANQSIVIPLRSLCTTGGPITITAVTATKPTGGMHVVDWGTRLLRADSTLPPPEGGQPGLVRDQPGYGHTPVTNRCGSSDETQFSVSVAGTATRATMTGVTVSYASGHKTFAQFATVLCRTAACPPIGSS